MNYDLKELNITALGDRKRIQRIKRTIQQGIISEPESGLHDATNQSQKRKFQESFVQPKSKKVCGGLKKNFVYGPGDALIPTPAVSGQSSEVDEQYQPRTSTTCVQ